MSEDPVVLVLPPRDHAARDEAEALARRLGVVTASAEALPPCRARLEWRRGRWTLAAEVDGVELAAAVELAAPAPPARGRGSTPPLRRAIGRATVRVLDATAGFGRDAVALAALGCRVLAVERSPVIHALLDDGVRRAHADPGQRRLASRLELRCDDAARLLREGAGDDREAIYLDPMYPLPRRRGAAARKEVRLLRAVVGDDGDAEALLKTALDCPCPRIVVKRPHRAPPLAPRPAASISSKLVRYDIYTARP